MTSTLTALVTDLIFATKITSTAAALDVPVKIVRTLPKLQERLDSGSDAIVLIDLNADGVDVIKAIELCRAAAHAPHTIAYASHVQTELIESARGAGAHEVLARSAFVVKLPALLATLSGRANELNQERGER